MKLSDVKCKCGHSANEHWQVEHTSGKGERWGHKCCGSKECQCQSSLEEVLLEALGAARKLLEEVDDAADLAGDLGPDMTVACDEVREYLFPEPKESAHD